MTAVGGLADRLRRDAALRTETAQAMHATMAELYPFCRSITGDGVRRTLDVLGQQVPLQVHEVPSGTPVFDWEVPPEWNVRDAFIADAGGRRVVDFRRSSLHLVSYSVPVDTELTLDELRPHLHSLPKQPDLVPYRTSYYTRDWGFCLSQRSLDALPDGRYRVVVDTTLLPGSLTYAECVLPGETADELVLSTHVCHPSLASDNLSGLVVATQLIRQLAQVPHRLAIRLILAPGTIGSLTWLAGHSEVLSRIRHGLVLTGLGGPGGLVYKRTRSGDSAVDAAATLVLRDRPGSELRDYSPYGYDERQYNAIGFGLPFGRLSRTPHGEFPEYHTSGDDLDFVTPHSLGDALSTVLDVVDVLDGDRRVRNRFPFGEPQLGRRGLYPSMGGPSATEQTMAMLWLLSMADGTASLVDVAERAGQPFAAIREAAARLEAAGVVAPA